MSVKKVNIFKDIELKTYMKLFFSIYKNSIFYLLTRPDFSQKSFILED